MFAALQHTIEQHENCQIIYQSFLGMYNLRLLLSPLYLHGMGFSGADT